MPENTGHLASFDTKTPVHCYVTFYEGLNKSFEFFSKKKKKKKVTVCVPWTTDNTEPQLELAVQLFDMATIPFAF